MRIMACMIDRSLIIMSNQHNDYVDRSSIIVLTYLQIRKRLTAAADRRSANSFGAGGRVRNAMHIMGLFLGEEGIGE